MRGAMWTFAAIVVAVLLVIPFLPSRSAQNDSTPETAKFSNIVEQPDGTALPIWQLPAPPADAFDRVESDRLLEILVAEQEASRARLERFEVRYSVEYAGASEHDGECYRVTRELDIHLLNNVDSRRVSVKEHREGYLGRKSGGRPILGAESYSLDLVQDGNGVEARGTYPHMDSWPQTVELSDLKWHHQVELLQNSTMMYAWELPFCFPVMGFTHTLRDGLQRTKWDVRAYDEVKGLNGMWLVECWDPDVDAAPVVRAVMDSNRGYLTTRLEYDLGGLKDNPDGTTDWSFYQATLREVGEDVWFPVGIECTSAKGTYGNRPANKIVMEVQDIKANIDLPARFFQ